MESYHKNEEYKDNVLDEINAQERFSILDELE